MLAKMNESLLFSPMKGKEISSRLKQSANAFSPMLVTLSGTIILVKPEQPLKAKLPILIILSGI